MTKRLQDLRARLRAWPPLRLDVALAAVVVAEALGEAAFADASWPARLAVAGPAALVAAGVFLRRRASLVAVAVAGAGIWSVNLLADPAADALEGPYFAWLFVTYSMATNVDGRRLAAGTAIGLAGTIGAVLTGSDPSALDLLFGVVIFVGAPVLAGRTLRSRIRLGQALAAKAEQLDRERTRRADEAAAEERARIAGELHDVVAHALGAMTIQAAAARRLAATDAGRAAGALEAIEHTGRDALGELRVLLDVLRGQEAGDEPALEPQPSLAALGDLLGRMRSAGLPVELEQHGDAPGKLPTGVDLTAYRVVQEALEAALKHGSAGAARVVVSYLDGELCIEVGDDGPADGRPLLALQERVRVCGGRVEADGGGAGHVVRAVLPLEGVTA